jgi:hypothetical protein
MPPVRNARIGDQFCEPRLSQPSGRHLAQHTAHAFVETEIERPVVRRARVPIAFAGNDENQSYLADLGATQECHQRSVGRALIQPVEIEPGLGFQQTSLQSIRGSTIDAGCAVPRRRLFRQS